MGVAGGPEDRRPTSDINQAKPGGGVENGRQKRVVPTTCTAWGGGGGYHRPPSHGTQPPTCSCCCSDWGCRLLTPTPSGTLPLPCAQSGNLRSRLLHQTWITMLHGCMAMVMVAAILLMVLMMTMMMLSMMSKMIRLSTATMILDATLPFAKHRRSCNYHNYNCTHQPRSLKI